MTEEYEILDAEDDEKMDEFDELLNRAVDTALEAGACAYISFEDGLKKYGLSMETDISDEDGEKLAKAMFAGGQELDDFLEYLAGKYGSERIGEGVKNAGLEQPRI